MIPIIYINCEKDSPTELTSFWEPAWCLFEYPSWATKDNISFVQVHDPDKGFHIRALAKTPIVHPSHPDFRMCPNFPSVYITKTGQILEGDTWTQFTTYRKIHYVLAEIPCQYHRQPVSVFRLYADAWGRHSSIKEQCRHIRTNHIPIPRNGDWQDYRPGNVKWVRRTDNQFMFERSSHRFDAIQGATFRSGDYLSIQDYMEFHPVPNENDGIGHDCGVSYGGTGGWMVSKEYGNSVDGCYAPFWCVVIYDGKTNTYLPAYSLGDAISTCRERGYQISRNAIRRATVGIHRSPL